MQAHRIEKIIQPDGILVLDNLPFEAGEKVEIIVLEISKKKQTENANLLRGSLLKYDDPFEPAAPLEDWEALK